MGQRERNFADTGWNRRRQRGQVEGKGGGRDKDLDTPEGAKIRQELVEKDVADLKRNWRLPMDDQESAASGGTPTIFVAASNATDKSKASADYVCDGTNDEEEINAAQAALYDLGIGGRVLLSEGTFHIGLVGIDSGWDAFGSYKGAPNQSLQGLSTHSTVLLHEGGTRASWLMLIIGDGFHLSDMTLDATGITDGGYGVNLYGAQSTVERVRFVGVGHEGSPSASLYLDGAESAVRDCDFIGGFTGGDAVQMRGDWSIATGNRFDQTPVHAVYCDPGRNYMTVCNNSAVVAQFDMVSTDVFTVGVYSVAVGNIATANGGTATIVGGTGSVVANNVLN